MTDMIDRPTTVGTHITPQQMAHQIDELSRAVRERPRDDGAWLALAEVLHDEAQRRYSLERALALNPANTRAQRLLTALDQPAFEDRLATLTATPTITSGKLHASTAANPLAERISSTQQRMAAVANESAQIETLLMPASLVASTPRPRQSLPVAPAIMLRPLSLSDVELDEATPRPALMTHAALLLLDAVSSPPERRHASLRERVSEALIVPPEVAEARPRTGVMRNPTRRYKLLGSLATSVVMALVLFASLLTVSPLLG